MNIAPFPALCPAAQPQPTQVRPDGDVELEDAGHRFVVPPCDTCGGVLKPDGEAGPQSNGVINRGKSPFSWNSEGNRSRYLC